jgi:polar amino acid transport system substrate-binding protein
MFRTLLLCALFLLSACSDQPPPDLPATETPSQPELSSAPPESEVTTNTAIRRVILAADPWCPHNCLAGALQQGYMVDIAREIFSEAGYEFDYQNYGWARSLQLAREQLIDGVVGALKGDAPDFIFPETGLGEARITLYTHPQSQWVFNGIDSLRGKTLLVINGYSYSPELDRYISENTDDPERIWILSGPAPLARALQLLERERTDVFVEDSAVMSWFLAQNTSFAAPRSAGLAHEAPLFIAFPPENPDATELANLLDSGLARLAANGRLAAILSAYRLSEPDL